MQSKYSNRSITRALAVLESLGEFARPTSLTELSKLTEIHTATLYRILEVLQATDYVHKDPVGNTYTLGYRLYRLGRHEEMHKSVLRDAIPFLRRVAHSYDVSVVLGSVFGPQIVIHRIERTQKSVNLPFKENDWIDAYGSAMGQAILAHRSCEEVSRTFAHGLKQSKSREIKSLKRFNKELSAIRRIGYALDESQTTESATCIALPLVNSLGYADFCFAAFKSASQREPRANVIALRMKKVLSELYEHRVRHLSERPCPHSNSCPGNPNDPNHEALWKLRMVSSGKA